MNDKIPFDDFVEQVALESGFDYDTAKAYVEDMFETIVEESAKGRFVKIRNFGSFQPRWYKAKRGINPQTKQPLEILPHYHIHFAVSKDLEKTLNNGRKSTPISLGNGKTSLFQRIIIVLLLALLVTGIYRTFFMPEIEVRESITLPAPTETTKPITYEEPKVLMPEVKKEIVVEEKFVPIPKPITKLVLYPGTHKVLARETLSHIALKIYHDSSYWPLIYEANRNKISDPDKIRSGMTLVIPKISKGVELENAYINVHDDYLKVDKMSKSFWILCEGAKFMGSDFQELLKKKLDPIEYKIIQKSINR